jgi:hypothetical protein
MAVSDSISSCSQQMDELVVIISKLNVKNFD